MLPFVEKGDTSAREPLSIGGLVSVPHEFVLQSRMDSIPQPVATRRLDPGESPIPEHHSIFKYWDGLRAGRFAPKWAEFDLMRLDAKVVPWTAVTDISEDGRSMTYRYWGTQLTVYRGFDYTNRSPLDIPPSELGQFIFDSYASTASEKKPCLDIEEFVSPTGRESTKSVLRLPLSDNGETVNMVVACMIFDISYLGTDIIDFFHSVHDT